MHLDTQYHPLGYATNTSQTIHLQNTLGYSTSLAIATTTTTIVMLITRVGTTSVTTTRITA